MSDVLLHRAQENRILLEKMERYAAYTGSRNLRPWTCRATLNFKAGMVFHQGTGAMQIDHMNQPVNVGTVAGGNRKTTYKRRKVPLPAERLRSVWALAMVLASASAGAPRAGWKTSALNSDTTRQRS